MQFISSSIAAFLLFAPAVIASPTRFYQRQAINETLNVASPTGASVLGAGPTAAPAAEVANGATPGVGMPAEQAAPAAPAAPVAQAEPATPAPPAIAAPPAAAPAPGAPATGQPGQPCTPQVAALAQGIKANIADQNNELATATALGDVLAQNPVDMTLYSATQSSLMGFVTKGISIRQTNQAIAPADSPALAGLATVAGAQATELSQTMSLAIPSSGIIDVAASNATVSMLKMEFIGGIQQNQRNLNDALNGCILPA